MFSKAYFARNLRLQKSKALSSGDAEDDKPAVKYFYIFSSFKVRLNTNYK